MKMKLNLMILLAGIILFAISCKPKTADENLAPGVLKVKVEEVIQTSNYTYLRVSDKDQENWIAISKAEVEEGKDKRCWRYELHYR